MGATLAGERTPRSVLEVWAAGADRVPKLVWIRDAESPSAATIAYSNPNVNVSWTPLSPLRSDSYEVRRPDGSLAGTALQDAVAFVDSAPMALSGAYTVTGMIAGVADSTPRSSNSLNLTTAPQTPAAAFSTPNVNVTWTAPSWGQPHFYHVYRNGVYQAQVVGTSLAWSDTNPPRGTQPTYTVYAVLSGTLSAGATTAAVNVPAFAPVSVGLAALPAGDSLRLTWASGGGTVTGFEVQRYVSSWQAHASYGAGTFLSDWATTSAGYMRVRALSAGGASDWVQSGPVSPVTPPPVVTHPGEFPDETYFLFFWVAWSGSATGYVIERYSTSYGGWISWDTGGAAPNPHSHFIDFNCGAPCAHPWYARVKTTGPLGDSVWVQIGGF